ncbi:MAG TPA: diguanylate cyclase [Anaerolineales bacterium]|nr:diguanylate cyclase [Anaerolineales bacterium]
MSRGILLGGDEALKTLANTLTRQCLAEDTIARHGGDEFLVILL